MIEVDKVTKYYGARAAVRDLTFRIADGECVGFLGLNGAGKSTTLKMLSCLLLPTSGRVRVGGFDVEERPHEIRKMLGFLPDSPPVYGEMTVRDFTRFAGLLRRMTPRDVDRRLPEVLSVCGLDAVAEQPIGTLSHGFRQRVGIAQAVVHDPKLLILDEPIQGLDPVQIVEMRKLIRSLRGRHTILLSTHILSEIEQTCDRILMLHEGRIAAQGTEDELEARFGAGGTIDVTLGAADRARVSDVLERLEAVADHELRSDADGRVTLRVHLAGDAAAEVSRALVEAGFDLLAFEPVATGLEQVFVSLSQGASGGPVTPARASAA